MTDADTQSMGADGVCGIDQLGDAAAWGHPANGALKRDHTAYRSGKMLCDTHTHTHTHRNAY